MIEKVRLKYFKQFKDQTFELKDALVLAGQNNSGKTTLLQAIATWQFAYREWQKKQMTAAKKKRATGISITRQAFLAVPVQRFNLLWYDASTALHKDEGGGRGAASPRIEEITLEGGSDTKQPWRHSLEFRYGGPDQIFVKPSSDSKLPEDAIDIVYVPSFSGIETDEKVHAPEYQDWLIGQGKPGDIIRNLLVEVHKLGHEWDKLVTDIENIFNCRLLPPQYSGLPFIVSEYLPGIPKGNGLGGFAKLEIASAGSGFLQTLLLLSFFYARPSSVLLLDEPDAHLHVVLQKGVYDHLRQVAEQRKCQLIVATHSEVIINDTSPERIVSFYDKKKLADKGQVKHMVNAMSLLDSMDVLRAKDGGKILYLEGHSDFKILLSWARILNHKLANWFVESPFYYPLKGNQMQSARAHFNALQVITKEVSGVILRDGDNKGAPDNKVTNGLLNLWWKRYEIENYLVHPMTFARYFEKQGMPILANQAKSKAGEVIPDKELKTPLGDSPYWKKMAASKDILPEIFSSELGTELSKAEYYKIAEAMQPDEIHPEVVEKLDAIAKHWGLL